jgi:hypothetical protein
MPLQNNINLFCFLLSFSGSNFVIGKLGLYANNTDKVNIISRAIALRGELQA